MEILVVLLSVALIFKVCTSISLIKIKDRYIKSLEDENKRLRRLLSTQASVSDEINLKIDKACNIITRWEESCYSNDLFDDEVVGSILVLLDFAHERSNRS